MTTDLDVSNRNDVVRLPIAPPLAWRGPDLKAADWLQILAQDQLDELMAVPEVARGRGEGVPDISPEDYRLPAFGPVAALAAERLDKGPGFAVIRGIPGLDLSLDDLQIVNWLIGLQFGEPVSQRINGVLVGDVREESTKDGGKTSNDKASTSLLFHADGSDVTSLMCVRQAPEGGISSLVSSMEIHNVILAERPDLLELLYGSFHNAWRGQAYPGARPFYMCPVFSFYRGYLSGRYAESMHVAYEDPDLADHVPPLSSDQREALAFFQEVATRPDMGISFLLEPGDYLLFNNYVVLHSRAEFTDGATEDEKRHLLRLWLAPPNPRPLAPEFIERYGPLPEHGLRGGFGGKSRPGFRGR